ncbi:MAG: DUF1731 domain-containing protein [Myxococcaceae bacterium]|nr:DUF1731 domain-containing protein [Myxococcaceae bacterium]
MPSALADCRLVYNLVGENIGASRWSEAKKRALRESRIVSTSKLVEALSSNTEAFLCASAVSAYPGDGTPCAEDTRPPATPQPSFIHAMTREWEAVALEASPNTRTVLLRVGMVIGDEGMLGGVLPLFRARVARHLGSPEVELPWVDPRDVARLLVFLAENPQASGAFNVVAPERTTISEFSEIVQGELGIRSWLGLPAWVVRLFLGTDASRLVLARYDARPERALSLGFRFEHTTLRDSIRAALAGSRAAARG